MLSPSLIAIAIAAMTPNGNQVQPKVEVAVKEAVLALQSNGDMNDRVQKLRKLDRSAIPFLIAAIPTIERGEALREVGYRLLEWKARESIRPLIESLATPLSDVTYVNSPAAFNPLAGWGYDAVSDLLRAIDHPNDQVRYYSALLLSNQCQYFWGDERISRAFYRLAKSPSIPLRGVAIRALSTMSRDPREGDNAFFNLCEMAYDFDEQLRVSVFAFLLGTAYGPDLPQADYAMAIEGQPWNISEPTRAKLREVRRAGGPRQRAAAVLILFGSYPDYEGLADPDPRVSEVASRTIDRHTMSPVESIAPYTKHAQAHTRYRAARSLGLRFSREALPHLEPLLRDANPNVRKAAQDAIDRIKGNRKPN